MRVVIGPAADFAESRGAAVRIGTRRIAVFRVGERAFAIDDSCPHRNFPLYDGTLNGFTVRCRTHGSCFDLASGALVRGPAARGVRAYPAEIVGGQIEIEMPEIETSDVGE